MKSTPRFLGRLALDGSADERAIRRAYARELKLIDQEADPGGFQTLREAYEAAMQWARRNQAQAADAGATETDTDQSAKDEPALPAVVPQESTPVAVEAIVEPVAPVVERPNRVLIEPIVEPTPLEPDPEAAASAVFSDLARRLVTKVTASGWNAAELHQRELRTSLNDPRLMHIAAHDIFEWHVARLLAAGWRPGHEALLVAAAKVFNWGEDRRRLARFGQVGAILNRAIDERAMFDQQPPEVKQSQRDIIARLRDPIRPSNGELIKNMALVEWLAKRFPVWIPLITSMENLQTWRALDQEVPRWRRRLTHNALAVPRNQPSQPPVRPSLGGWLLVLVVFSLLKGLDVFLSGLDVKQQPPPPDYMSKLVQQSSTPSERTPPAIPAAPRGNGQASPSLLTKRLAAVVKENLTSDICREAAALAKAYGMDAAISDGEYGRAFNKQVIACSTAGMWPRGTRQDPVLRGSVFGGNERLATVQGKPAVDLSATKPPSFASSR
jgi:hypothetical protein